MAHLAVPPQVLFEHQMLANVTSELRTAIDSRNLSNMLVVTLSFQNHLKRTMALEEKVGYMPAVLELHPEATVEVEALQGEHRCIRRALSRLLSRLRRVSAIDHATIATISHHLLALLDRLYEHCTKEVSLLQRTLLGDEVDNKSARAQRRRPQGA